MERDPERHAETQTKRASERQVQRNIHTDTWRDNYLIEAVFAER